MGLSVTYGCWCAGYGQFHEFRKWLALQAGFPPLALMEGFYRAHEGILSSSMLSYEFEIGRIRDIEKGLPIRWSLLGGDPIALLLSHSDSDGDIPHEQCAALADRLQEVLDGGPKHPSDIRQDWDFPARLRDWIEGLRSAVEAGEGIVFQ